MYYSFRTDNQAPTEYMYTTLPPPTNERKRSNAIPASVPSLKRSKVTNAICQLTPEVEAVRLSTPPPSVLPSTARREVRPPAAPAGVVINGDLNIGRGSRGQTPPIVIDEAEMDRKVRIFLREGRELLVVSSVLHGKKI